MITKNILCLLLLIGLFGCATAGSINRDIATVEYSDGINMQEAKLIAQKYCLDDDYCSKNCMISSVSVYENKKWYPGQWRAGFDFKLTSSNFGLYYVFSVDKKTGELSEAETVKK